MTLLPLDLSPRVAAARGKMAPFSERKSIIAMQE
jgi:hypothetical protein